MSRNNGIFLWSLRREHIFISEKSRELSPEEKLWAIKAYLSGKGSTYSIAAKYGVTDTIIRRWVARYEIEGVQAFRRMPLQSSLAQNEKLCAVHEYLDGEGSYSQLCITYKIPLLILSESGLYCIMMAEGFKDLKQEVLPS